MSLDVTGRFRYPPPDPSWLALNVEDVIDPALPIIDAHHHLWTEGDAPYLLPEIAADVTDGHHITSTVFVQAHYGYRHDLPVHLAPVGETEKVVAIAAAARCADVPTRIAEGIVAHADLLLGSAVGEVIDAHEAVANGALRGIRHSVSRDENFPNGIVLRPAPADLLADPRYRAGLATLSRRGLSYDAMLYHAQIPELTAAARAEPSLPIVLDHLGCVLGVGWYEGREAETFVAWRRALAELATCANVSVKFGGLGMVICGARWHESAAPPSSAELATAWRPYFEACIELFGAQRCMFESNFPVDKAMYSYRTLWNAFKRLTAAFGDDERRALFSGTASRFYRIVDPVRPLETTRA
jgi:predicted TIM-barrel fold metal-dependent hydrolase